MFFVLSIPINIFLKNLNYEKKVIFVKFCKNSTINGLSIVRKELCGTCSEVACDITGCSGWLS